MSTEYFGEDAVVALLLYMPGAGALGRIGQATRNCS